MMSLQQSNSRIPLGLLKITQDTFKCAICRAVPITPPVIVAKCCKSILGCDTCVNSWYSRPDALTKHCPKCRVERGYNETLLLHGLDDFLTQIKNAIEDDDDNYQPCELLCNLILNYYNLLNFCCAFVPFLFSILLI